MKKVLALVLVVCLSLMFVVAFANTDTKNDKYTINEAYKYPITPSSKEWRSLSSKEEKLAVCKVSEDVLNSMTTDALIETIVSYPLLIDMCAYNTIDAGIQYVSQYFKGIVILEKRSDAVASLTKYLEEKSKEDNNQTETIYAEIILKYLRKNQHSA